ncbi:beta-lactamase/transpeptidase-like protein [Umbelopsis sp. AD052]|nr:beta-lactamase/transpeptidase-like protein [Umbelopsis sp. AD052]
MTEKTNVAPVAQRSLLRQVTVWVPVLAWIAFRVLDKGDFTPYSCAVAGFNCPDPSSTVSGFISPEYAHVKDLMLDNIIKGDDVGAGVALYVDGQLKIDMYAGWMDRESKQVYTNETLQMVFSCSKVLTGIVIARLVDEGHLSYDQTIATYWPEFAQGNKENVTLKDLMEHAGGVAWLDEPLKVDDFKDTEKFSSRLAAQPHNWNGTKTRSYHALTRGWYLNEIVRRVDPQHRTIGQIAQQEINHPYDVEWYYSPGPELDQRIAKPYHTSMHQLVRRMLIPAWLWKIAEPVPEALMDIADNNSVAKKAIIRAAPDERDIINLQKSDLRRYESPSFSGHTNARSIAKMASIMANRGQPVAKGEPSLLSANTFDYATTIDMTDMDEVLKINPPMTVGGWGVLELFNTTFMGWTGAGGSLFYWNEEFKIGFGYCMNSYRYTLGGDRRSKRMLEAIVAEIRRQKENK